MRRFFTFDWKFLLAIAVAIATPIGQLLWDSNRSLYVAIISVVPLTTSKNPGVKGMRITLENEVIDNASAISMELRNSGTKPIAASDFERALEISFGKDCKIVSIEQSESEPASINAELHIENGSAFISPLLLNPGDRLRFSILSSGDSIDLRVRGRISGVSDVKTERADERRRRLLTITLILATLSTSLVYFIFSGTISGQLHRKLHVLPRQFNIAILAISACASTTASLALYKTMGGTGLMNYYIIALTSIILAGTVIMLTAAKLSRRIISRQIRRPDLPSGKS